MTDMDTFLMILAGALIIVILVVCTLLAFYIFALLAIKFANWLHS